MPDFLIIGAMKSGTSSLFAYLSQHPEIYPSLRKEVRYFDGGESPHEDNFAKGHCWYRGHFSLTDKNGSPFLSFEATPIYMFNPLAARRIYALLPEAKPIAILRNPTERAISHYYHEVRHRRESLPLFEALQEEEQRLEPAIRVKAYRSRSFIHYSYKMRGLYKDQLEKYLHYFSRQQLLVLSNKDLFSDPDNTLRRVFSFLEVDAKFKVKDLKPRNVANERGKHDARVLQHLDDYFRPHNQALYELLGRNFGW